MKKFLIIFTMLMLSNAVCLATGITITSPPQSSLSFRIMNLLGIFFMCITTFFVFLGIVIFICNKFRGVFKQKKNVLSRENDESQSVLQKEIKRYSWMLVFIIIGVSALFGMILSQHEGNWWNDDDDYDEYGNLIVQELNAIEKLAEVLYENYNFFLTLLYIFPHVFLIGYIYNAYALKKSTDEEKKEKIYIVNKCLKAFFG